MHTLRYSRAVAYAAGPGTSAHRAVPGPVRRPDDARALERVFQGLSGRYEEHCRRTGAAESPALCAAATRFRRERDLVSLVSFADCLDQLDIPASAGGRNL